MRANRRWFLRMMSLALAGLLAPRISWGQVGKAQAKPRRIEVMILGMSCPFCAYGVQQKLRRLEGVEDLEVDLESGVATLALEEGADIPNETLRRAVEDAGFEVASIKRSFESEHPEVAPTPAARQE